MNKAKRRHQRRPASFQVRLQWLSIRGETCSAEFRALDVSDWGMRLEGTALVGPGTQVQIQAPDNTVPIDAVVRFCAPNPAGVSLGLEFCAETPSSMPGAKWTGDYYEVLQLSPCADMETIHRVYRMMAARFHPDNAESGDPEKFLLLSEAYAALSDPGQRAQYDGLRVDEKPRPLPLFQDRAFVDGKDGEANRRLGVLCLLYGHRRRDPYSPCLSLLDLEALMAYPREYLEFTLWYLRDKGYIARTDCSDFAITASGVDFVEEHSPKNVMLQRLLQIGPSRQTRDAALINNPNPSSEDCGVVNNNTP
jgi:DnaJ domain